MNRSIFDRFNSVLQQSPDQKFLTFVSDDGSDKICLTRAEFENSANIIANSLVTENGLKAGDVVLLVYPQSIEFCIAFWACLKIGVIPAPLAPPNPFKLQQDMPNFRSIVEVSKAKLVLSESLYMNAKLATEMARVIGLTNAVWPKISWVRTDKIKVKNTAPVPAITINNTDIAYLQFTSGSTSVPKGVKISFGNLQHQLMLQEKDSGVDSSSVGVLWVPQFHDMCLVAGIISCIAGNGHLYLISPLTFLKDPAIWVNVMNRVRATHTAAPNFALNLLVKKTTEEQRRNLDLSSLKILGVGGEPNIGEDAREFLEKFSVSKLPTEAYSPCYGIAENTLVVTICGKGTQFKTIRINKDAFEQEKTIVIDNERGVEIMSNGQAPDGTDIRVMDPATRKELTSGKVGEFWVSSPSNGMGYYNQPEISRDTFENDIDGEKFMRTGDLGFIIEDELYITGRLKELIIIRGRNIYPQDAERTLQNEIPEIKPGRISVFSIMKNASGQEEKMIVLCEPANPKISKSEITLLVTRITQVVSEQVSVVCSDVLVLKEGSLVKTASCKIKRVACSEMYQSGAFQKLTLNK